MTKVKGTGRGWSAEHLFYTAFAVALMASAFLGFADTFYLKHWYPEGAVPAPPEPFFAVHGISFTAWLVLLVVQCAFVGTGRVALHRRLGTAGGVLAFVVVVLGVYGALLAAHRPTGFVGVPVPPLEFLTVPLVAIGLFASFVTLAILKRRDMQSHKRLMLLATLAISNASIARWPFEFIAARPIPIVGAYDLVVDLFLVPLIIWDLWSRRRLHPVTVVGGLVVILSAPLGSLVSVTGPWLAFAKWAVALLD